MPEPGTETILVVDDELMVLAMTHAMLSRYGYPAIPATSGKQALDLLQRWTDLKIHLALIDVVMRDMDGPELAAEIHRIRPELPVLYMTGFVDQHQLLMAQNQPVVYKPFTSVALIKRIRQVLDRPQSSTASSSGPG